MADPETLEPGDDAVDESSRASLPPARNKAMDLLSRREHSRLEMAGKLADRGYADADIVHALEGLIADNLISDERFAEAFVASRVRKGQGPVRICMELKKRGIAADLVQLYLYDANFDWAELAADVRQRKFGGLVPAEFKQKARQMRFLEYRGFTSEQIRAAVD